MCAPAPSDRVARHVRRGLVTAGIAIGVFALVAPARGDDDPRPIRVTIGQPSLWTLEQAHYLLSRMHDRNRGLRPAELTPATLDPNRTHGSRMEVLKTFFGVSAGLDQPAGRTNALRLESHRLQVDTLDRIRQRLVDLRERQLDLVRDIAEVEVERAALAADDPQRPVLAARVAGLQSEKTVVEAEIGAVQPMLTTASSITMPDLGQPTIPTTPTAPTSLLGNLFDGTPQGFGIPQIDASTALDNHIQLQYEMIAKQLTLLRDEVGPDRRIVFLELPASFDPRPKKAKKRVVRVEWEVVELCRLSKEMRDAAEWVGLLAKRLVEEQHKTPRQRAAEASQTDFAFEFQDVPLTPADIGGVCRLRERDIRSIIERKRRFERFMIQSRPDRLGGRRLSPRSASSENELREVTDAFGDVTRHFTDRTVAPESVVYASSWTEIIELFFGPDSDPASSTLGSGTNPENPAQRCMGRYNDRDGFAPDPLGKEGRPHRADGLWYSSDGSSRERAYGPRSAQEIDLARVVDVIPRRSTLNVNQVHKTQRGFGLSGKIAKIFGFGASAAYQRQKEVFDQFMTQDVFASGYGKGTRTFGWTFGPRPGTQVIAPGQRTTYAAVLVPRDAIALRLKAVGWDYAGKRDSEVEREKACTGGDECPTDPLGSRDSCPEKGVAVESFILPILGDDEGFFVTKVEYSPVRQGERIIVQLRGSYFSPQIGVLVDGVPLRKSTAIGRLDLQHAPSDERSKTSGFEVEGTFERVNATTLTLSFRIEKDFVGTPIISLVTPQKSYAINFFEVDVLAGDARGYRVSLAEMSKNHPMFAGPLSLTGILSVKPNGTGLAVEVAGAGFNRRTNVAINGQTIDHTDIDCRTPHALTVDGPRTDKRWLELPELEVEVSQPTSDGFRTVRKVLQNPDAPRLKGFEVVDVSPRTPTKAGKKRTYRALLYTSAFPAARNVSVGELGTDPDPCVAADAPGGEAAACRALSDETFLVQFTTAREQPVVEVRRIAAHGEAVSELISIVPPVPPSILEVAHAATGKPTGLTSGGYTIAIHGTDLQDVVRVLIGERAARIVRRTPHELLVTAPEGVSEGAAYVRLETDVEHLGRRLTNAADFQNASLAHLKFTFTKPTS